MPTFADLLSSMLNPPDPNDLLRDPMQQGQTLTGMAGKRVPVPGKPHIRLKLQPPIAPSPNVLGPLATLGRRVPVPGKPHIRLKLPM